MPLQAVTRALDLPDPVIRANDPRWIFAETCNLLGTTMLLVQRTPIIRDDSPQYKGIADLLGRHEVEQIYRGELVDPDMMFGKAEVLVYLLHSTVARAAVEDPRAEVLIDMITSWGDPVPSWELERELNSRLQAKLGKVDV